MNSDEMTIEKQIRNILIRKFSAIHVNAAIGHFSEAVKKYQRRDWEGSLLKVGKFTEAIIKCLAVYCGQSLPRSRNFKVGVVIKNLGQTSSQYNDTIRLLVPRACIFIYDIASNRGTRHDPDGIDPNQMDATVTIPVASWILSELIRFVDEQNLDLETARLLVENLSTKKYPYFEEIGGRMYVNIKKLSARGVGLLILNAVYPRRIKREFLIDLVRRHGVRKNSASVAVQRLKNLVDDDNDNWKLRVSGLQEADEILNGIEC